MLAKQSLFELKLSGTIIICLVIISIFSTNQALAQQVCNFPYCHGDPYGYQNENFMLKGNPFFCIDVPPINSHYILSNVMYSLGVWQHFLPKLKMHYLIGTRSANCNIFIHFVPTLQGANGITMPNFPLKGKATIKIPYNDEISCNDPVTSFSLTKAIEHETGHALGLGHFVLHSQQESDLVIGGKEPSPSIMVTSQCGALSHASVTALDGAQVMRLR